MPANNQIKETVGTFSGHMDLVVKKKFIPKRRTPYLMQDEIIRHKEAEIKQADLTNRISSQLDVNKESISSQKKIRLNLHEEVARLYGLQKKVAHFFVQCCIQHNQNTTGSITAETLCRVTGSTKKTIKKIIQRMIDKKLIKRIGGKRGKGGFTSFEVEQEFIDVIRLQIEIEFNNVAQNKQFSNPAISVSNKQNSLSEDWEKIDLTVLIDVLRHLKTKNTQFFGKAQLRIIQASVKNKLSSIDIQNSINAFAYGLKNYSLEEPYKSMINPAAILLDTLKNGDKWEEKRYLFPEEEAIYKIYINISKKIQENIRLYYKKWIDTDRDKKFNYYQLKMRSTDFYNDKIFEEKAWDDYEKNLWPKERKVIILDMMNITDQKMIDKFDSLNTL